MRTGDASHPIGKLARHDRAVKPTAEKPGAFLVVAGQLGASILGGCFPDALLESSVERRVGVESNSKRNIKNRIALTVELRQQFFCVLNPVLIQIIKKTHTEPGIYDL